jgi:hypothetical protein
LYWNNFKKCSRINIVSLLQTRMPVYLELGNGFQKLSIKIK